MRGCLDSDSVEKVLQVFLPAEAKVDRLPVVCSGLGGLFRQRLKEPCTLAVGELHCVENITGRLQPGCAVGLEECNLNPASAVGVELSDCAIPPALYSLYRSDKQDQPAMCLDVLRWLHTHRARQQTSVRDKVGRIRTSD